MAVIATGLIAFILGHLTPRKKFIWIVAVLCITAGAIAFR